jgi:hypothetical protein
VLASTRVRLLCAGCLSLTALSCAWSDALDSDPKAWNPEKLAVAEPAPSPSGDAGAPAVPASCDDEPPLQLALEQSAPGESSHRVGEPCLAGCHEPGGSARLAFAAAGSAYQAQGSRVAASPGSVVQGIGGTALPVDACGNFYAIAESLKTAPQQTQPWVRSPTFHRMEKSLAKNSKAGDCNQSGCHDFSGRLNAGIYF